MVRSYFKIWRNFGETELIVSVNPYRVNMEFYLNILNFIKYEIVSSFLFMPGWHGGLMRWLSSMLTVVYCRFDPNFWTDNFVLSVCCCVIFLASLCYQEHSYSYGGVNCLNSVLYHCCTYVYRSSPLVLLGSCLTAAACLSSAYVHSLKMCHKPVIWRYYYLGI